MINLDEKINSFKNIFQIYLKAPDDIQNQTALKKIASELVIFIKNQLGAADEYTNFLYNLTQNLVRDIEIKPDVHNKLDNITRSLGCYDESDHLTNAFEILNIICDLKLPSRICLKNAIRQLLTLEDQFNNVHYKNIYIFFGNPAKDSKLAIISPLLKNTSTNIFNASKLSIEKEYSSNYTLDEKISFIEKHIDNLFDKQLRNILNNLCIDIEKSNNKWLLTFFAKILKTIKDILGIKPTEQDILEKTVQRVKQVTKLS